MRMRFKSRTNHQLPHKTLQKHDNKNLKLEKTIELKFIIWEVMQ